MRNLRLYICAALVSLSFTGSLSTLSAQSMAVSSAFSSAAESNPRVAIVGLHEVNGEVKFGMPSTLLAVDIDVERSSFVAGNFARYALKYLGVSAEMVDKTEYTVVNGTVSLVGDNALYNNSLSGVLSQSEELPLSVDKIIATSDNSVGLSDESRAEAFAKRLFLIRHQRSELISGDVGEAVFGDGLQAALQRMAEEEEQILKMFVGVTKSTVSRVRFYIKPEADKKTYILARFSQRDGVCDVSGINGAPIYLQVSPMELPKIDEAVPNSKGEFKEPIVQYMIAADASCALYSDVDSITTVILPIFEYGRIYNIAAPKKK